MNWEINIYFWGMKVYIINVPIISFLLKKQPTFGRGGWLISLTFGGVADTAIKNDS